MKLRYTNYLPPGDARRALALGRDRPRVCEQKLTRLKEQLIKPALLNARDQSQRTLLQLAASEAEALAWSTGYGLLFLPALLDEKVENVRRYAKRQAALRTKHITRGN